MAEAAVRPEVLQGRTLRYTTGCGNLYIIVNDWPEGEGSGPREVFAQLGKAGGCASTMTEAVAKMVSKALQHGASAEEIAKDLVGISCDRTIISNGQEVQSCVDAIGKAMRVCIEEAKDNV